MTSNPQAGREPPLHLINKFSQLKVLVIGEAMLDSYLEGPSDRLCREAPVPVVTVAERKNAPGGAGNTAVNVCSLGGQAHFISVIGADAEGEMLRESLRARGVSTEQLLVRSNRRTVAKTRVIAQSHMLVRFDQGSTEAVDETTERRLLDLLGDLVPECDAVVVSDYGYGILTPRVIRALSDLQQREPRVLVVDSKHLPYYRTAGVTAVKPNYREALQLLNLRHLAQETRAEGIAEYGDRVLDITGARIAAITLDSEGALIFERGSTPYRTYAKPTTDSRAAGAGDTFISALTLAIAAGAGTPEAAELASAAAAIVVAKDGTSTCAAQELREYMSAEGKYIRDRERLAARAEFYRQQGQRIVFTNGCFDILHSGHIAYLNRAKALGNILIVGVNSDESVKRLKGPERPINNLQDRVDVLAALSCIDHLVAFNEDTPAGLIRALRPDVYVKGGDYTRATLPETPIVEALGGDVKILPYLENHSTTSIIERIRKEQKRRIETVGDSQDAHAAETDSRRNGGQDGYRLRLEQRRKRVVH